MEIIRRGDIWLINYRPDGRDGEAGKTHLGIIMTNNHANAQMHLLMTIPLTSNTEKIYFTEILLPVERTNLEHDSKAQIAALRSTHINRLIKRLGFVPEDLMQQIDEKMRLHLGLR